MGSFFKRYEQFCKQLGEQARRGDGTNMSHCWGSLALNNKIELL